MIWWNWILLAADIALFLYIIGIYAGEFMEEIDILHNHYKYLK